jgi:hypothetical protein
MIGQHLPPAEPLVQPRPLLRRYACHDNEHRDTADLAGRSACPRPMHVQIAQPDEQYAKGLLERKSL